MELGSYTERQRQRDPLNPPSAQQQQQLHRYATAFAQPAPEYGDHHHFHFYQERGTALRSAFGGGGGGAAASGGGHSGTVDVTEGGWPLAPSHEIGDVAATPDSNSTTSTRDALNSSYSPYDVAYNRGQVYADNAFDQEALHPPPKRYFGMRMVLMGLLLLALSACFFFQRRVRSLTNDTLRTTAIDACDLDKAPACTQYAFFDGFNEKMVQLVDYDPITGNFLYRSSLPLAEGTGRLMLNELAATMRRVAGAHAVQFPPHFRTTLISLEWGESNGRLLEQCELAREACDARSAPQTATVHWPVYGQSVNPYSLPSHERDALAANFTAWDQDNMDQKVQVLHHVTHNFLQTSTIAQVNNSNSNNTNNSNSSNTHHNSNSNNDSGSSALAAEEVQEARQATAASDVGSNVSSTETTNLKNMGVSMVEASQNTHRRTESAGHSHVRRMMSREEKEKGGGQGGGAGGGEEEEEEEEEEEDEDEEEEDDTQEEGENNNEEDDEQKAVTQRPASSAAAAVAPEEVLQQQKQKRKQQQHRDASTAATHPQQHHDANNSPPLTNAQPGYYDTSAVVLPPHAWGGAGAAGSGAGTGGGAGAEAGGGSTVAPTSISETSRAGVTPLVSVVHCHHGKDRTGQLIGAYKLKYLQYTLQQVIEENLAMGQDLLEAVNALMWYCLYLEKMFSSSGAGGIAASGSTGTQGGLPVSPVKCFDVVAAYPNVKFVSNGKAPQTPPGVLTPENTVPRPLQPVDVAPSASAASGSALKASSNEPAGKTSSDNRVGDQTGVRPESGNMYGGAAVVAPSSAAGGVLGEAGKSTGFSPPLHLFPALSSGGIPVPIAPATVAAAAGAAELQAGGAMTSAAEAVSQEGGSPAAVPAVSTSPLRVAFARSLSAFNGGRNVLNDYFSSLEGALSRAAATEAASTSSQTLPAAA